jgi:hypothetical protein
MLTRLALASTLVCALAGCGADDGKGPAGPDGSGGNGDGSIGNHDSGGGGDGPIMTTGCGTCPSGYTCGSANGIKVCRAPSGVPLFTHVFVIVMENTSQATLKAATNTPYLTGLYSNAAWGTDYHGVAHPSLPNYVALTSGSTQGIGCDCLPTGTACTGGLDCNALVHSCACNKTTDHVGNQLESAGKTWRAYAEDAATACNVTDSGGYATKHVPFLYFDDVQTNTTRCMSHVVDYAASLPGDLSGTTPNFVFIAPNLTHDMHDPFPASATNYANGDTWLGVEVPKIQATSAYKQGGVIVIVWDEDDASGGLTGSDDPVPIFVLSPLAKTGGFMATAHADHYALLATIEDGLGVGRIGMAAGATPLTDYFPAQ